MSPEKTAVVHDMPIPTMGPEAWRRCWLVAFSLHWPWVRKKQVRFWRCGRGECSGREWWISYSGKGFSKPVDVQCGATSRPLLPTITEIVSLNITHNFQKVILRCPIRAPRFEGNLQTLPQEQGWATATTLACALQQHASVTGHG